MSLEPVSCMVMRWTKKDSATRENVIPVADERGLGRRERNVGIGTMKYTAAREESRDKLQSASGSGSVCSNQVGPAALTGLTPIPSGRQT